MGKLHCKVENKWCKHLKRGICLYCNTNIDSVSRCPRLAEIETKRLADLLKTVSFDDVFVSLCKWFTDQERSVEGYREVFNKLLKITPHKHYLNDLFISIDQVEEDGKTWMDVSGIHLNNSIRYGVEFCPWTDWISMFITQETLDTLSPEEIVAGCLYEMTYFGFTESKVQDMKDELISSVKETMEKHKK